MLFIPETESMFPNNYILHTRQKPRHCVWVIIGGTDCQVCLGEISAGKIIIHFKIQYLKILTWQMKIRPWLLTRACTDLWSFCVTVVMAPAPFLVLFLYSVQRDEENLFGEMHWSLLFSWICRISWQPLEKNFPGGISSYTWFWYK